MANKSAPILLVEDSVDDFESISRALKKENVVNPLKHVVHAEDGLKYLASGAMPCLIFLDLNMSGMGGVEFLKIIKLNQNTKEIPVIILTCSDDAPVIKACYAYGANAYIVKSSDFNVLASSLKRVKEYWLDTVLLPAIPLEATPNNAAKLTQTEIETLTWIAKGKSRWETGVILGVTEDAVKNRLEGCRRKLDAANTTHAISLALRQGLLFISL